MLTMIEGIWQTADSIEITNADKVHAAFQLAWVLKRMMQIAKITAITTAQCLRIVAVNTLNYCCCCCYLSKITITITTTTIMTVSLNAQ